MIKKCTEEVMKKDGIIQTPFGPLFENPDLAKLIIDELKGVDLKELFIQPSVLVSGDDCGEHKVNGIRYVAFTRDGNRIMNEFVAQGALARTFVDLFGKKRVCDGISAIRKHFELQGVPVYEEERLYK